MIEIQLRTNIVPNDPYMACPPRPKVDVFIEGFNQLCEACGMHNITTYKLIHNGGAKIPTVLKFDDGTSIGISKLFDECGFKILET